MASVVDAGTMLMPLGTYNSNQSFTALQLYPRQLGTSVVTINLTTPPVASAVFVVEEASTSGGTYREVGRLTWLAGMSGPQTVPLGVSARAAWMQNNQAQWLRISLTTTGALTGSAWVTKASDGGPGLGAGPNAVLTGVAS
jgi:hypothetical protein